MITAVYRCFLYLGDLSRYDIFRPGLILNHSHYVIMYQFYRYRELYTEKEQKDFSESVRFYERASLIMPASGNAHNQVIHSCRNY
jgi:hypothetical protein